MKKRIIAVVVVVVFLVAAFGVGMYGNQKVVKKTQARTIEDILGDMDESVNEKLDENAILAASSNPYDYIENNKYFDELVDKGVHAVPDMLQNLKQSKYDGLTEYMIAVAIERATETKLKKTAYAWKDAKEFVDRFEQMSENRVDIVKQILESEKTEASITDALEPYGLIGMEALSEMEQDDSLNKKYRTKLKAVSDYVTLSEKECNYMKKTFLE